MNALGIASGALSLISTLTKHKSDSVGTNIANIAELVKNVTSSATASSNPAQELRDYMNMSYSEKMQWSWMNAHGVNKEAFAAMSSEDKQKLVDQMRDELKSKMGHDDVKPQSISIQV